ncbi:MAG: alpha/beta hydrolase fold protein [uncultured bacterium]|nr:MAG: alpha/beta hydrolase fold protein [uncultured bacterium]HLD44903.1 alpha/beta hydrolase [bacterium]
MGIESNNLSQKRKTTASKTKLSQLIHLHEGYARSQDGTRIWYQSQGQGTPIIFCNGLGCSWAFWKHVHAHFAKKHQVIVFDWRCHGKSEHITDEDKLTIDTLAEDMHAVLKKLTINKAIIAGYSMGTQVLYRFWEKYPKKVLALIPCCGTYSRPMDTFYNSKTSKYIFAGVYIFNHFFPRLSNSLGHLLSKNPLWWQMGTALEMLNPGLADRKVLKEYIEHFTAMDSVMLTALAQSMQDYNAEPILKRIHVPTLIIAAENDRFTPVWISKKMHHLIPQSELIIIKKATHVALVEQPALINLRIEKFLQERL